MQYRTMLISIAAFSAALGCDQGTAEHSDAGLGPAPKVVATFPSTTTKVGVMGRVRAQFDRFLLPPTDEHPTACLKTGTGECDAAALTTTYDPVDRVVVWAPKRALTAGTQYTVQILAPENAADPNGIRAFDRVPLEEATSISFTPDAAVVEPPHTVGFCPPGGAGAQATLTSCTATGTCHGVAKAAKVTGATFELSDGKPNAVVPSVVKQLVESARIAPETATGPDPSLGSSALFGQNMPFIDKGRPGNSFALYKMILNLSSDADGEKAPKHFSSMPSGDAGAASLTFEPWIVDDWKAAPEDEHVRLRARLRGDPMPPSGANHDD
ncbi:MAG TPA: Ig-like domain-containing protein, partial [Polyangiaceae bacterium]|nr:Ig-like domain-containing protein [Polyangiaceae bacterium]